MLERQIEGTIWLLAGLHPDLGICITSQLQSARAKLIVVEGLILVRMQSEDLAKQVRRFMNEIEGPTRKRNRIIHDPMSYWKGEGVFFVRTHLDKGVHRRIEVVELDYLKRFFEEITDLMKKFSLIEEQILEFKAEFESALQSWLETNLVRPSPIPPRRSRAKKNP